MPPGSPHGAEAPPFLRLRFSSLLALAFLGIAAIALAYVGGVMSGRASAGAERRLAAVESARTVPPPSAEAEERGAGALTPPAAEAPERGILAPEELRFARALRNEDGAPEAPAAAQRVPASTTGAGPRTDPGRLPGQMTPAAQAAVPGAVPPATDPAPAAPGPGVAPGADPAAPMHDYVFQVGAFRDEESVDNLRQRLEGWGLRTRMQREGKLYVVLVLLRGDAARAEEVMRIAEELRLGAPMVRSRKPVRP
ncbi:SPOR domain-containing protein [uncultured Desulfovibrio sp.]|uniref:SPOR domain-containing protein n=7 Tax=uncultured Desulfovibrio sp. TaxID=167968 RepID=UPI0025D2E8EF|nr:SPOR domain-containing protein [uncultured Desulfovibrio sp.]